MRFYLVRHAQSENNALPERKRVHDPSVTEVGTKQAQRVAEWIAQQIEFDTLLTSAFRRALITCQHVARATNQVPEIVVDLHESGGCYRGWQEGDMHGMPGMNAQEIESEFYPIQIPNQIGDLGWWRSKPPESDDELTQRAKRMGRYFSERIDESCETMLCISHADFIDRFLRATLGSEVVHEPGFHGLRNTGVTCLQWSGKEWELVFLNCSRHLPTELVTE